jgi:benzoate/toluate 1,2-dioxygenase beta subunit
MTGAMSSPVERLLLVREVEEFLFREARLLDERRFEEWMALFTDDGVSWVPAQPHQESPFEELSIYYEDKSLMDVRIRRLQHPETFAQVPPSRTRHIVGNVVVDHNDAETEHGGLAVRSNLVMVEYRDDRQLVFAADCRHDLRRSDGGLRIASKRVDLVNCDAAHGIMSVPF